MGQLAFVRPFIADGDCAEMILDFIHMRPTWTLVNEGGNKAIDFDVFLDVEVKGENQVAYEQLEKGSFAAYNKQASPLEIRINLAMTKPYAEQQSVLDALEELCGGTELVSLITPAQEYDSLNLESYNYRRTETNNSAMLAVELRLVEIRQVESSATTQATEQPEPKLSASKTKNPSNASDQNTGKTQAKKPPVSVAKDIQNRLMSI